MHFYPCGFNFMRYSRVAKKDAIYKKKSCAIIQIAIFIAFRTQKDIYLPESYENQTETIDFSIAPSSTLTKKYKRMIFFYCAIFDFDQYKGNPKYRASKWR